MQAMGIKKGREQAALPKLAVSESLIRGGEILSKIVRFVVGMN
jgi:hypothetical protein